MTPSLAGQWKTGAPLARAPIAIIVVVAESRYRSLEGKKDDSSHMEESLEIARGVSQLSKMLKSSLLLLHRLVLSCEDLCLPSQEVEAIFTLFNSVGDCFRPPTKPLYKYEALGFEVI